MTEDEAKQKWCPQVRFSQLTTMIRLSNRSDFSGATNCLASGCMAWRWAMAEAEGCTPLGYCGLGGKP